MKINHSFQINSLLKTKRERQLWIENQNGLGSSVKILKMSVVLFYRRESIYRWNGIIFGLVLNIYKQTTSRECLQLAQINNLLLQQIPSFISNALFLTKVCLWIYNRQSQQRPFYRSRKWDSYGTEVYKQTTSRECLQLAQINKRWF
jgi:hypothetical protein